MRVAAATIFGSSKALFVTVFVVSSWLQLHWIGDFYSHQQRRDALVNLYDSPVNHHEHFADSFSVTKRGGYYNRTGEGLMIDALSIGTQYKRKLLEAQASTWARHVSIRNYYAATELDDADKTCYRTLNRTMIEQIANTCANGQPHAIKSGMEQQTKKAFHKGQFMERGAGWMCAQQRFAVAIETLGRLYRRQQASNGAEGVLPDFLLIQDDDTWWNMARILDFLRDKDPSIPLAEAPCLIRHTLMLNFSFPWGGYGLILSRGALENLIRPIMCSHINESDNEFERFVCRRLDDDIIGERQYFRNGMSVSDLMGAHVRNNLFTQYSQGDGNWAYCLHGDWALGYFVNYYYVASHTRDAGFESVPQVRIEGTLGGTFKEDRGNCVYGSVETCSEAAHVCHRQTVESMVNQTREVAAKAAPDTFPGLS